LGTSRARTPARWSSYDVKSGETCRPSRITWFRIMSSTPVLAALIAVQVLFGVNYVISKVVVDHFPPLVWGSMRVVISALFMIGAAILTRRPHPRDGKRFFLPLIVFSLLGIILNQTAFLVGLHYTTATNSAVLNTLIPVFTLMVVTIRGQEPLTLARALGFVSALAGVLVLRKVEEISLSDRTLVGDLLTIFNCFSYALFLSYSKSFLEAHDRLWTTAWLFVYGSVGITLMALPQYATFTMPELTPELLACMAFAIFGGTLGTYFLNIWALAQARASSVALFIYLQPVVATALAWAWHGQAITPRTVLSTLLI
jgi:drug/metabolite transporter (DMT)-like permease